MPPSSPSPSRRPSQPRKHPIDRTMERASAALERMDYFLAERLALESLRRAHNAADFGRMARIVLPLLEARRQKRQLATDIAASRDPHDPTHPPGGQIDIIASLDFLEASEPVPGCFLFQPPLIGIEARNYRDAADAADTPVFILTREPLTRDGLWPILAVGATTLRTKIVPPQSPSPPWPPKRQSGVMTADDVRPETHSISLPWFEAAAEQLGDAAIARLNPDDPAAWHVDDLMEALEALPEHEKLHQRLEEACLRALHQPLPDDRRHRPLIDDPFTF